VSFSAYPIRRGTGWATEPVPDKTLERTLPDRPFIGSTVHHELRELFGIDIRDSLTPDELRVVAEAIRQRTTATHTCNCDHCGWIAPDLGAVTREHWLEIADYFTAVASEDWGFEGEY
jgi:hypothetical protein